MLARAAEVQVYMIKTPVTATRGFFRDTIEKSQGKKKMEPLNQIAWLPMLWPEGK